MPPHSFPITFEEVEAKEWASNTVSEILTDVSPILIECKEVVKEESKKRVTLERVSTLRRSLSFLESNLFRTHPHEQRKKKSRSLSTDYPLHYPVPKPSISSRIRPAWTLPFQPKMTDTIHPVYLHKLSTKERKGIILWKKTLAASLEEPLLSSTRLTEPLNKRAIQLSKYIRTELITTEDTYLHHLLTIKKYYMDPLFQAAAQKRSLVHQKDMEVIFAHIPQLIHVSYSLTLTLHSATESSRHVPMGKVFCDYINHFDVYIAYAVNFCKSRKYLEKASSTIVYRQLVKDSKRKRETNRMLLSDYMIAPIQRITRYTLLLKELQKYTPHLHPDWVCLDKAIKSFSALALAMNSVQ
ncbi:Dbl homology domain-containing protein [Sporodiniella umbellata]|nr:Dbl homology domain-containing protein [Sporodiniella umbellata]